MAAYEDTFGIPDLLVDTGSCGSLKEGLLLGTIVQGKVLLKENESLFHSPPIYINDPDVQYVRLLEVENAVMNEEDKKIYQIRADVCTMESYRIFSKSIEWNCRFLSLRVVTDHAIRPFSMKLYAVLKDFLMNISH
jgi:nucleoside phosphorylase